MAAYRRVDDLRSPAGWLPVHRDQLRAQRSASSMRKHLPLPFYYCDRQTERPTDRPRYSVFNNGPHLRAAWNRSVLLFG